MLANLVYFTVDECAGEMATPFGADANDVDMEKLIRRLDKHSASLLSVHLNAPVEVWSRRRPSTRLTFRPPMRSPSLSSSLHVTSYCPRFPQNYDLFSETRTTNADGTRRCASALRGVSLYQLSHNESDKREARFATQEASGLAVQIDECGKARMQRVERARRKSSLTSVGVGRFAMRWRHASRDDDVPGSPGSPSQTSARAQIVTALKRSIDRNDVHCGSMASMPVKQRQESRRWRPSLRSL